MMQSRFLSSSTLQPSISSSPHSFSFLNKVTSKTNWYCDNGFAIRVFKCIMKPSGDGAIKYKPHLNIENQELFQIALFLLSIRLLFQAFESDIKFQERIEILDLIINYYDSLKVCCISNLLLKHLRITRNSLVELNKIHYEIEGQDL
ncbi:hypothetical protein ACTFIW_003838 [Dictyostelium discoideum]